MKEGMKTYMREYVAHGMLLNYYLCNMDREKKQVDYKTEKVQAKYALERTILKKFSMWNKL